MRNCSVQCIMHRFINTMHQCERRVRLFSTSLRVRGNVWLHKRSRQKFTAKMRTKEKIFTESHLLTGIPVYLSTFISRICYASSRKRGKHVLYVLEYTILPFMYVFSILLSSLSTEKSALNPGCSFPRSFKPRDKAGFSVKDPIKFSIE